MTSSKPRGDAVTDTQAELDRLRKLRRDVAAGLLEVSKSAKRDAETLLAADQASDTPGHETESDHIEPGTAQPAGAKNVRPYGIFGVGLACGFVVALLFTSSGDESPASVNADAIEPTGQTAAAPVAAEPVEPTPPLPSPPEPVPVTPPEPAAADTLLNPSEGLVVRIRASGPCWISAELDGNGAPVERLLSPDDEIVLEALEQAVLRIGDPSAISMSINGRPTRSLGPAGRAVDLHITRDNFQDFLDN